MKLTEKQAAKALEKLNDFNLKNCSVCHNNLQLNNYIFELNEFSGGDVITGSKTVFPVVALICSNCGHTHFFNAVFLGIVDKDNDD